MSDGKKKEVKKETGLGLTFKKEENFGEWYSEVSKGFFVF
jgi:prolyl-tRNA synthetase